MNKNDIAIRVNKLGKMYRIGKKKKYEENWRKKISSLGVAPFEWLINQMRGPTEEEVLWSLRDVSFEVKRGEVLGIIGQNGAGKSTLLKILSHITEPSEGYADISGRVASLLEVGTGMHPELTGRENTYLNGTILGMKKMEIDKKFDEIVEFADINKFIDTPVKRYSSGMRVRLGFAIAAHLEPEILLIDEVLAVGDAAFQKKCLGKMSEVSQEGRTILFVSHNMNAVQKLCGRAILLQDGQLARMNTDVYAVTSEYLFGKNDESRNSEWINPGELYSNLYFHPLRLAICDDNGQALPMPIRNDANAWIRIEGEIDITDPAVTIGYAVFSDKGDLLYWSYQTDAPEDKWPQVSRGYCKLQSRFPKRLLNEGVYRIELIASLHFRKWLLEPGVNAPSVFLTIQGGLSDSSYWMNKRPGLLAPVHEWRIVS